ncbi:MAG: NFACT RNA binding domain-containing protein, partial [Prosthecochloris sp.]
KSFPFRTVALPSGATLFLGKNAANNDLLTFSFAKPHDIWLHARGSSGSHGILRGSCMQNRTDIQRAAEIVAFHSAARHSTMVPVMYTEKKYVRKSGSRLPGQVRLDREEVILVTPSCI